MGTARASAQSLGSLNPKHFLAPFHSTFPFLGSCRARPPSTNETTETKSRWAVSRPRFQIPWCASSTPFQVGAASISWAAGGASRPPAFERTRARGLNFGAWTPIRPASRASAGVFGPRLLLGSQEAAKTHQRPSFYHRPLRLNPLRSPDCFASGICQQFCEVAAGMLGVRKAGWMLKLSATSK